MGVTRNLAWQLNLLKKLVQEKMQKKLAVMHVTKIVQFDWYGMCLKVSGT